MVRFNAEIDDYRGLKKGGMKVTLVLDSRNEDILTPCIKNFRDKPLIIEMNIDTPEQLERLKQISSEQRKKIYAILKDISKHTGQNIEAVKEELKLQFIHGTEMEPFSLSNCEKETAEAFITYLVGWSFMNGVSLKEHPREMFEDIETYMILCLKTKVCCICGKPGETHHWDAIGAGRDRRKYDDSDHRKIQLCRTHHSEAEQIGRDTFAAKYHVIGVIYNE
jgi:hypothetical protein